MSNHLSKISEELKVLCWTKMQMALDNRKWKKANFWFQEYIKLCK